MASIVTIADYRALTALPEESVNDVRLQQVLDCIDAEFTATKGPHPMVLPTDTPAQIAEKNADLDRREMLITSMAEAYLNLDFEKKTQIAMQYPNPQFILDKSNG